MVPLSSPPPEGWYFHLKMFIIDGKNHWYLLKIECEKEWHPFVPIGFLFFKIQIKIKGKNKNVARVSYHHEHSRLLLNNHHYCSIIILIFTQHILENQRKKDSILSGEKIDSIQNCFPKKCLGMSK